MIKTGDNRKSDGRVRVFEGLQKLLRVEPKVRFAYAFGSSVLGTAGPLSDLDIAVYCDERVDNFDFKAVLTERLVRALGVEKIDLVVLNKVSAGLGYSVISTGILLKESKARRVEFETSVLKEYLDFAPFREVQLSAIGEQIGRGEYFG
jgi:predicted nucleotidyltransferase